MVIQNDIVEAFLNSFLGGAAFTPVATVYLALVTDDPLNDGTGFVEVVGGSYARVSKTNNTTNFPACVVDSREKKNGVIITWPTATASWGAVVGVAVFAAASGGDAMAYAPFAAPETVNNGNVVSLAVNQLIFRGL